MARKKGQTYTAEQKAKIVLELLKEERTINQIASEYKVTVKSKKNDTIFFMLISLCMLYILILNNQ